MTPEELAAVRERLEEFAAEMFAPLSRSDQRDKGATYVRGLLLDGRRKSMQPMAARLGVDEQGLQQAADATLAEHAAAFTAEHGVVVSLATMSRALSTLPADDPAAALTPAGRRRRPGRPLKSKA